MKQRRRSNSVSATATYARTHSPLVIRTVFSEHLLPRRFTHSGQSIALNCSAIGKRDAAHTAAGPRPTAENTIRASKIQHIFLGRTRSIFRPVRPGSPYTLAKNMRPRFHFLETKGSRGMLHQTQEMVGFSLVIRKSSGQSTILHRRRDETHVCQ